MIGFNTFLESEGISPADVKLVRHQDNRLPGSPTPYQLWRAADGRLDLYQKIQRRPVFKGARLLASFVATPFSETLFVGIYEVRGVGTAAPGLLDPITGQDVGGLHLYDLAISPKLGEYRGRIVIDWGLGFRSWTQRAHRNEKTFIEIRRSVEEPPFPGFLEFQSRLTDLAAVPSSWRIALSAATGVYLLVNPETGKQYVGSARGTDGFWGRWEQYAASGHGGNRRMQDIPTADYLVAVLEVASASAGAESLFRLETRWKQKLLSRKFGLNAN